MTTPETTTTETGFRKYDHVQRLGHPEVQGLTDGLVHVFPKIDGTNAPIWFEDDKVRAGSRNRELSLEADNAGFFRWLSDDKDPAAQALNSFARIYPDCIFYGEWLVPHTLKTYREEAWRRFYLFDVYDRYKDRYLSYDEYTTLVGDKIDVIPPLCTFENPSDEQLQELVAQNKYLIEDGQGLGEGIVIKNYLWRNKFGRQPWAKIVRNEFTEKNHKEFGPPKKTGEKQVEREIAEHFVTLALVEKTRAKVLNDLANAQNVTLYDTSDTPLSVIFSDATYMEAKAFEEMNRAKVIPQLLGRVFYDLIGEEMWAILKKFKNPTIDFKLLNKHTVLRVRKCASDLF